MNRPLKIYTNHCNHCSYKRPRRGLTLFESLIAIGLLLATVTAVMSALAAGRQHANEARLSLSAGLAAEMLMARVTAKASTPQGWNDLADWHGYQESTGRIEAGSGALLPDAYQSMDLKVQMAEGRHDIPSIAVSVDGRDVKVEAHDTDGVLLAEVVRFVPEPQQP
jgi:type II secretory pathway pseudopilin PulG